MDCSMAGFPIHHQLLELAQTHVHQVSDTIKPPHPLSSPSPPAFNLSQHQGLFIGKVLGIRWSFSFSISPPKNIEELFFLGFHLLTVQQTLKSYPTPQSKYIVQLSHPYKTKGKAISSVQLLSCVQLFAQLYRLQHARHPYPSQNPGVYSDSCPLSQWCHPTISSSVIPFSFHLQSFPASASYHMSQFFASGGQSMGVTASASVLPMNIQDWFPLGWTCRISLKSKGPSRVFSNITVQKHQFFDTQLSL